MECERNYLLVGEKDEVNKKQKKSDLKNILQKFGKKSSLRITFMVVTATVCLFFFFAEFLLASHEIFRHFEWRVIL